MFAVSLVLSAMLLAGAAHAAVSNEEILQDPKNPQQIVTNGLGVQGQRYSPLDLLNANNVKELRPVWAFSFGGEKQRGQQAQPLIKDGVMYLTGSYSRVFAVDARTGKKLWQYDARLPDDIRPCCDVINRGVALYGDLVFFGTLDAKLVALNKDTGKVVWSKKVADHKEGYSISAAPMIVNGKLITGVAGGEFGVVGKIQAYNPENGELLWMRPTVEGHMGYVYKDGKAIENGISGGEAGKTWPGDLWKTGGAAPWLGGYYDPETNLILFGTGNPAPWNSHLRPGDNLYSSSRLALNPDDGTIKWHFQSTPHDGWDFDGVNELISFNYKDGGKEVKAAATADRNGFFYVLDRTNGKFIRGFPFVDKITWPPAWTRTAGQSTTTPAAQAHPAAKPRAVRCSSPRRSSAPRTGCRWPITRTPGCSTCLQRVGHGHLERRHRYKKGAAFLGAGFTIKPLNEDYIGVLRAIDPISGKEVWRHKNYAPLWGGVLTTKGNLVFTGTPEGFLQAFNAKTGDKVWEFQTGSGVLGSPVTWEMDGEQYVSVVSGWGGAVPLWGGEVAKRVKDFNQGGMLWTFKLPKQLQQTASAKP